MRNLRIGISTLSFLIFVLVPGLRAQTGDWQAVKNIRRGTGIFVALEGGPTLGPCILAAVNDDGLICEARGSLRATHFRVPRDNVQAVYLQGRRKLIGLGIGAAGGGALGALHPSFGMSRGGSAFIDGMFLGGMGLGVGAFSDEVAPGKLVYSSGGPPGRGRQRDREREKGQEQCNGSCGPGGQGGKVPPDNGAVVCDPVGPTSK